RNVAPVVDAGPDLTIDHGGTFRSTGSFRDPGSNSWRAVVDYGDNTGVVPLTLKPDHTFDLNHNYSAAGTYTVTGQVTDEEGLVGSDTLVVTIKEVAMSGSDLLILVDAGSNGAADVLRYDAAKGAPLGPFVSSRLDLPPRQQHAFAGFTIGPDGNLY